MMGEMELKPADLCNYSRRVRLVAYTWPIQMNQSILYVGTYTVRGSKGIYASRFDHIAGRLSPPELEAATINPSFLRVSLSREFLYTVSEIDDFRGQRSGAVISYRIDHDSGRLIPLNQRAS